MPRVDEVISSRPDVMSGTPVFAGTRVSVKSLLDYLAGGSSLEEFVLDFPTVSREQAVAVLKLAAEALTARARPAG